METNQYKLYGFTGNLRSLKVLATAAFVGAKVEFNHVEYKDVKHNDFRKKNPVGKIPVLETPSGYIFESNAIIRYLARQFESKTLYGSNVYESGLVDQWLDFCQNELEPSAVTLLLQILGQVPYNEETNKKARKDLQEKLKILENQLKISGMYLVGNNITIADIAVVSALSKLFTLLFDEKQRKAIPTTTKYVEHCRSLEQFVKTFGKLWLCQKEFPVPEQPKQEKPQKQQQQKAQKPKEEAKTQAKPAAQAHDDDEAPKEKAKNPLDCLPETKFSLYDYKTLYTNAPNKAEALEFFWKNWDPQGFSIWFLYYQKYTGEGEVLFQTNNLMNGFLQRLDHFRKYTLAVHGVYGKEPNLEIRGCWLWRGTDIPNEMKEHPNFEYYTFKKADPSNPADKQLVDDYFTKLTEEKDEVEGLVAQTLRVFK